MSDLFSDLLFSFLPWSVQVGCIVAFVLLVASIFTYGYVNGGFDNA
ncbi:hypothetical protein [Novosphingobium lentum]|nr:hypothetical protein [Novosphingobium lentum]